MSSLIAITTGFAFTAFPFPAPRAVPYACPTTLTNLFASTVPLVGSPLKSVFFNLADRVIAWIFSITFPYSSANLSFPPSNNSIDKASILALFFHLLFLFLPN